MTVLEFGTRSTLEAFEDSVVLETEYLDLDGDGIPDAVRVQRAIPTDPTHQHHTIVEELASEIDIAGVPHHVEVHARR